MYIYRAADKKSTFQFLIKQILITFDSEQLESKFKLLREAKSTIVIIQKSQLQGSSLLGQKMDPIREKNPKKIFLKNEPISLDYYPKDFKFSGYEGLIHRKICHRQLKTQRIYSGLQWVLISRLSHFQLIFDDEISV